MEGWRHNKAKVLLKDLSKDPSTGAMSASIRTLMENHLTLRMAIIAKESFIKFGEKCVERSRPFSKWRIHVLWTILVRQSY